MTTPSTLNPGTAAVIAVIDNPGEPLILIVRTPHNEYAVHVDEYASPSAMQRAHKCYERVKPKPVGTYGGPERTTGTPVWGVVAPTSLCDLPPVPRGRCARTPWLGSAAISLVRLHEGLLAQAGRLGQ